MEYFHSKLADLQREKKFLIRRDSDLNEIFQNSLSVENFVPTNSFFQYYIKLATQKFCESNYCKVAPVVKFIQLIIYI